VGSSPSAPPPHTTSSASTRFALVRRERVREKGRKTEQVTSPHMQHKVSELRFGNHFRVRVWDFGSWGWVISYSSLST